MRFAHHTAYGLREIIASAKYAGISDDAMRRLRWFLFFTEHNYNASLTCRHFAIARSTLLRWLKRFDPNDLQSLEEESRKPHSVRQPEIPQRIVDLIKKIRIAEPTMGKERIQVILKDEYGIDISSSSVGRVITRHRLFFAQTKSHQSKREFSQNSDGVVEIPQGHTDDISSDFFGLVPGVTS